jgi:hypothetical protein
MCRYLKTWFALDLIAALPYAWFIDDIKLTKISFIPENIEIEFCETPFAKGCDRYAYAAYLIKNGKKAKHVLKESIYQSNESNSITFYQKMIETMIFLKQNIELN